jgi:hypothetical protein
LKNEFINAEDSKIYPSSDSATAATEGIFRTLCEKSTTNNLTEVVLGGKWYM